MDKVWIIFNEEREVQGVCSNEESASKLLEMYEQSTNNKIFNCEEHEVEN